MQPLAWLTEIDRDRAAEMQHYVIRFWEGEVGMLTYTPHDPSHFRRVEQNIQRLIPKERWSALSEAERMLLTWCAWTHDVGMNKKCYPDTEQITPAEIRDRHVDESAKWVKRNWKELRLGRGEAQIICDVIRYHSRKYRLADCADRLICETEYIRPRLMAAYLRLADAIEVGQARPGEHEFDRFPLFQDLVTAERDEILFHWVKSFVVAGIAANHEKQIIEIEFQNPKRNLAKADVDSRKFELLTRYVVNELREELETVEATLASGGISYFQDVADHTIQREDIGSADGWPKLLPTVINHLQMVYSPNSTGIARAALDSLRHILDEGIEKLHKPQQLQARLSQLTASLDNQLERRNCHNEVVRIRKRIEQGRRELDGASKSGPVLRSLVNYAKNFERMLGDPIMNGMGDEFWAAVERLHKPNEDSYRFLLFGCSESVAGVLAKRKPDLPITLYIAEGRPKTMHGAHNSPLYVDAESYAAKIREREASEKNIPAKIVVIPDACVATAFLRQDNLEEATGFTAVLFGSNGIYYGVPDLRESNIKGLAVGPEELQNIGMCVAHTVGHLGVAITAKAFKTPVIVVAASAKVAEKPTQGWARLRRANKWLTTNQRVVDHLVRECNARIDWTPREEHVPFALLSLLVSEKGTLNLQDTSDLLSRKLRQWDEDVTNELDDLMSDKSDAAV